MAPLAPQAKDWLQLQPESLFQRGLSAMSPPFQNGRLFAEMGVVAAGRKLPVLPQAALHHAGADVTLGPPRRIAEAPARPRLRN